MLPALSSLVALSFGAVPMRPDQLNAANRSAPFPAKDQLQAQQDPFAPEYNPPAGAAPNPNPTNLSNAEILAQSWAAYRERFIQADGRVIDRERDNRTVSEGQAYAMLRAVMIDDPATFELTLNWAEANLRRHSSGQRPGEPNGAPDAPTDSLWAWKWGQGEQGWGILDPNFASDADVDAATALILASRRWNRPDYLELAQQKLKDLWELSTLEASIKRLRDPSPQSRRYLLPGPASAFQPQPNQVYLNPSYMAPAAFRLFAQVDPSRDWASLVDSSYDVLEHAILSEVGLPSDWVMLDLETGRYMPVPVEVQLRPTYSFDAFRIWWRVALDADWFGERRAKAFLTARLPHIQQLWQTEQRIPARINLRGAATAQYEATSQYAMLYPALLRLDQPMAEQIRQQKILPAYHNGIWDNDNAYYVQNLAWLGLFPAEQLQEWVRQ
jgi:endoglucanase